MCSTRSAMSISVKKEAPGPTSVRQPSGTRASTASSGAGLRGRRAAPPPARPKATTPGCLSCCGGAIEHDEVANAAFDPLLPLPDIDFTNHFTRGLLAPVATAACPFTACGARVAASNLAAHTLRYAARRSGRRAVDAVRVHHGSSASRPLPAASEAPPSLVVGAGVILLREPLSHSECISI